MRPPAAVSIRSVRKRKSHPHRRRTHTKLPRDTTILLATTISLNFVRLDTRRQQGGEIGAASQVAHVTTGLDDEAFGPDEKMAALRLRRSGRRLELGEVRTEKLR